MLRGSGLRKVFTFNFLWKQCLSVLFWFYSTLKKKLNENNLKRKSHRTKFTHRESIRTRFFYQILVFFSVSRGWTEINYTEQVVYSLSLFKKIQEEIWFAKEALERS